MRILAIETSCDETAAAVVEDGRRILSSVVSSQTALHSPYGGVVPELASRHHLENICPVIEKAVADAGLASSGDVDAIAVTQGPGLVGALLVGVQAAKGLAYVHGRPLVPVHHIAGHIEAPFLAFPDIELPALALVVSGGHTSLFEIPERGVYRLRGRTRDDAAGEAYDKVAKLLGLGYPGGPLIDRLAVGADDHAVELPIARFKDGSPSFSFSGLKTAVLYHVRREGIAAVEPGAEPSPVVRDLLASFQRAAVETLLRGLRRAAEALRPRAMLLTGGVAANSRLRADGQALGTRLGIPLYVPPLSLTTDNAAMIAAAGQVAYDQGVRAGWDLNAEPRLPLG